MKISFSKEMSYILPFRTFSLCIAKLFFFFNKSNFGVIFTYEYINFCYRVYLAETAFSYVHIFQETYVNWLILSTTMLLNCFKKKRTFLSLYTLLGLVIFFMPFILFYMFIFKKMCSYICIKDFVLR